MTDMPRARYKESHKPVNRARRYEVDQITDGAASPKTVIPQEYWEDFIGLCNFFESLPANPHQKAPF